MSLPIPTGSGNHVAVSVQITTDGPHQSNKDVTLELTTSGLYVTDNQTSARRFVGASTLARIANGAEIES